MSYIGNPIVSTDFPVDYKSGNGSTTAFTLSVAPASVNSIDVQISGVSQSPQTYSVSGTTLTFSAAPPTGTNNIVVRHLGIAGVPNTPSVGSVTPALLSTANAVYWDGSGNVGVGTTSAFNYSGYDKYLNVRGTNNAAVYVGKADTDSNSIRLGWTASGARLDTLSSVPFTFGTNDTERARIDANGNFLVGQTTASTTDAGIWLNQTSAGYGRINLMKATSSGTGATPSVQFYYNGTSIGAINNTSTATSYATSSDYRLKENIAPMTGALATVSQLKPVTYKWKIDGSEGQGFIAHELQAVVPDCVTGEKDAVDAEGKPVYQGIDTSFLVATLTAAIQELNAKVDAQALEIQALKGTV